MGTGGARELVTVLAPILLVGVVVGAAFLPHNGENPHVEDQGSSARLDAAQQSSTPPSSPSSSSPGQSVPVHSDVHRTEKSQAPQAAAAVGPPRDSYEATLQAAKAYVRMLDALVEQVHSDVTARALESSITSMLEKTTLESFAAKCGQTLCRIDIEGSSPKRHVKRMAASPPEGLAGSFAFFPPDDPQQAMIFAARSGHALPPRP